MEQRTLAAKVRSELRKGACKKLRREGKIPAVVYGHSEPLSITIDDREFRSKFKIFSENIIINLDVDGKNHDVLIKAHQESLIKDEITHLDFFEVEKGKALKAHVPVRITGTAKGVKVGGRFEVVIHEVEVECLPKDLPETLFVDVTELGVGKSIHVSDLVVADGVRIVTLGNQVVCHVVRKRDTIVETEEESEEAGE